MKIEAYFDGEYWCARGIGAELSTQGRTLDKLMKNVREAVSPHFEEESVRGENLHVLVISDVEVKGASVATG